jgi:hypothetical protein
MKEQFEELTIESLNSENGQCIKLTQNNGGNPESVAIHPAHLRFMAEKWGLIPTSEPQALKTIATLERRMMVLHGRIEFLQGYLAKHSDHKHADLSYEVTYATATLDIADAFCAEFDVDAAVIA